MLAVKIQTKLAEVVASNTRQFTAEMYENVNPPAFGSWIVTLRDDIEVFALVSHIEMGSVMPNRQAMAYGMSHEELQKEMPQVLALMRTTFQGIVLGYRHEGSNQTIQQTLPPRPANIHGSVRLASPEQIRLFGAPFDFLRSLVRNPDPLVPADELLVAALRQLKAASVETGEEDQLLLSAGRALNRLLNDDHERLQSILRRV